MPGPPARWPSPGGPRPVVLAHRGGVAPGALGAGTPGRGGMPWENTVAAFAAAGRTGADGVELDVRAALDGTLVVLHDPGIPGGGLVHATRSADLPPWLPTLADALEACGDLLVDLELKAPPGGDPAAEALGAAVVAALAGRRPPRRGPWLVTSFHGGALAGAARAAAGDPSVSLGLLVHPLAPPLPAVSEAAALGAAVLLPPWPHADAAVVAAAHDAGLAVVSWTANDQAALEALATAGADGVVTDDVVGALAWRAARARAPRA